jgi:hypothetical protein
MPAHEIEASTAATETAATPPSAERNRVKRRRAAKAAGMGLPLQNYTVDQYCVVWNESPSNLYRKWARGEGPPRYKDGHNTRIPVAGAAEYHRRLAGRGA